MSAKTKPILTHLGMLAQQRGTIQFGKWKLFNGEFHRKFRGTHHPKRTK